MSDMLKNNEANDKSPWLVAAWPGMGSVAIIATLALVQKLGAKPVAGISPRGYFDVEHAVVSHGLVGAPSLPRSVFYRWTNPSGGRDLVFFIGEAQPSNSLYNFAQSVLDCAAEMGVSRVITFASMASDLHPSADPRVRVIATRQSTLEELSRLEVSPLTDGKIGGMNGVILAVGAERGVDGLSLLSEIPFYAVNVPSPRAAKSVLEVFAALAGIEMDVSDLDTHAQTIEKALLEMLDRQQKSEADEDEEDDDEDTEEGDGAAIDAEPVEKPSKDSLDFASQNRIEQLFEETQSDRTKAAELKRELDELGMFNRYEDRFLDLFKRVS